MANPPSDDVTDPRIYFAAERTLLAWVRTGLALMGFGFVVARFGVFLHELAAVRGAAQMPQPQGYSLAIGVALVIVGVIVNLLAAVRHYHTIRRLQKQEPLVFNPFSLASVAAVLLALLGVAMVALLLFVFRPEG